MNGGYLHKIELNNCYETTVECLLYLIYFFATESVSVLADLSFKRWHNLKHQYFSFILTIGTFNNRNVICWHML